jgi:DNA polymerase III subunit beta
MNIKVDRYLLLSELYYLQCVADRKQSIPILSHILIDARPGKILMRATDLDLTIATECEADVREGGSISLPARKLMEIMKLLPQDELEIKADSSCHAAITCNRSKFKLMGTNADHFPGLQQFSGEFTGIPAEIFSRFIPCVIYAVGQECSNYVLNGVKLEISEDRIRMVATDGYRLALVEREGRFNKAVEVILPRKTLVELLKICAASDEMLLLGKDDNHIRFKIGKRELVSCMLAGHYPDYSAVLPKDNINRLTVNRGTISSAIKRVALIADKRSRAVKLEIGAGKIGISSQSAEHGEAGETISIDYQRSSITVSFNWNYLYDIFNALDEDELLFEVKNGESPAQFTINTPDQDRCLAVIMPLRI